MTDDDKETTMTTTDQPSTAMAPTRGSWALPDTLDSAASLAERLANSGMVPDAYRGKPDDIVAAMMLGASLNLAPMQALQGIAVIRGRPSVWGDTMLAVCQAHPAWGGMVETIDGETATCKVWRKGQEEPYEQRFTREMAVRAGLWNNKGPWTNYPARMLQMRARGFALRAAFADALKGLSSAEEMEDFVAAEVTERDSRRPAPASGRGIAGLKETIGVGVQDAEFAAVAEADADLERAIDENQVAAEGDIREHIEQMLMELKDSDQEAVAKAIGYFEDKHECPLEEMGLTDLMAIEATLMERVEGK